MAVDKLVDSTQLDSDLEDIADAIRTKGGTSAQLAFPNEFVSAINAIPTGGGGGASEKQINFIDYDGTLLYSYTKAEINAMSSESDLPANPSHTGLTAQGWNWTLAQIKAQLTAAPDGPVWVGQMYITQSGNTEIDVSMPERRLSPIMTICVNGTITVDWGDNTTPDTVTGTSLITRKAVPHTYASAGDYTIVISVTSGKFAFYGSSSYLILRKSTSANDSRVYANCIQNIRLGSGITSVGEYAFYCCDSLASITIPSSVTSIGTGAFNSCYSLTNITIPDGATSIGGGAFNSCCSLTNIAIPYSVTSIGGSAFYYCYSLASVTIPDKVTSIGDSAFQYCSSLASVTIPDGVTSIVSNTFRNCYSLASITIPDSVTSIGANAFQYCYSLASATIPDKVTSIGDSAFYVCYSLTRVTIPDSVTSIGGSAFYYCYSLASVTIPDGVTSIGNYTFYNCYPLTRVTIPDSVTSIGSSAFNGCYGMAEYHFLRTTPPTLSNTNAFNNIPSDCVMYVPYSADHSILNAYKTASNWSTYASRMQEEPQ